MVLAAALGLAGDRFRGEGWGLPALEQGRVALVGVRALDEGERELLGKLDAKVFTMSDVDRLGIERAIREALTHVAGPGFVHVSLDMDAIDPDVAPGVGTPVRGGLSYREAHLAMELVAESGLASSLDVVEVNPVLDRENETGKLAVELVGERVSERANPLRIGRCVRSLFVGVPVHHVAAGNLDDFDERHRARAGTRRSGLRARGRTRRRGRATSGHARSPAAAAAS